jgi:hypothetical protein
MNGTILKKLITMAVGMALFPSIHVHAQPAGVPGAFRLFVNIISAGETTGKAPDRKR